VGPEFDKGRQLCCDHEKALRDARFNENVAWAAAWTSVLAFSALAVVFGLWAFVF